MGEFRDENYVTETIFIPLYNRSATFRDFVSNRFGKGKEFGVSLRFTGDERPNDGYGNPDAKTEKENIVEIKIKLSTRLQKNEEKGGEYEKYLKKNPDRFLLYVLPKDYDETNVVKGENVKIIHWDDIVKFLRKQNNTDPMIGQIYNKVENIKLEENEMETVGDYKAKVYEVLTRVASLNSAIRFELDGKFSKDYPLSQLPKKLGKDDWQVIDFNYIKDFNGKIWFNKDEVKITFGFDSSRYDDILLKYGFTYSEEDNEFITSNCIISQPDFLNKDADEISFIFNEYLLKYQSAINEAQLMRLSLEKNLTPVLEELANKYKYKLDSKNIWDGCFSFTNGNFEYYFEFNKPGWNDFYYGVRGTGDMDKKIKNILPDSKCEDGYPSWKYAKTPWRKWNEDTFKIIKNNPQKIIDYIDNVLNEITKALKGKKLI